MGQLGLGNQTDAVPSPTQVIVTLSHELPLAKRAERHLFSYCTSRHIQHNRIKAKLRMRCFARWKATVVLVGQASQDCPSSADTLIPVIASYCGSSQALRQVLQFP